MTSKESVASAINQAEANEVKATGQIGGQPKQRYYTPDGSVIFAMPDIHEYSQVSNGKIIAQGLRDANLDRGWLTTAPERLQFYCPGCDKWHPTQQQLNACIKRKKSLAKKWERAAKLDLPKDFSTEITGMKSEMNELKSMFSQVLERLGGK